MTSIFFCSKLLEMPKIKKLGGESLKSESLFRTNTYILHYNSQNKGEILHEHWKRCGLHVKPTSMATTGTNKRGEV